MQPNNQRQQKNQKPGAPIQPSVVHSRRHTLLSSDTRGACHVGATAEWYGRSQPEQRAGSEPPSWPSAHAPLSLQSCLPFTLYITGSPSFLMHLCSLDASSHDKLILPLLNRHFFSAAVVFSSHCQYKEPLERHPSPPLLLLGPIQPGSSAKTPSTRHIRTHPESSPAILPIKHRPFINQRITSSTHISPASLYFPAQACYYG